MRICKVIGSVWATKKNDRLEGAKLMIVEPLLENKGETIVAADSVGAGIGEKVLVVTGSTARFSNYGKENAPIDACIVGIIDSVDIAEEATFKYQEVD